MSYQDLQSLYDLQGAHIADLSAGGMTKRDTTFLTKEVARIEKILKDHQFKPA